MPTSLFLSQNRKKIVYLVACIFILHSYICMNDHMPLTPLRELKLSEREKQFIRNTILTKQRKAILLHKVFFASRVTGYVAVSAFWLFVLVSSYRPQQWLLPTGEWPVFTLLDTHQGTVQADTIGRLLEIQWVVHVIKNGTIVPKTDIAAGEIVVLQPWAELVVQVRATTFAKITWPAKFVLEYIPEIQQTVLNLLEGKLIEVTTTIASVSAEENDAKTPMPVPEEQVVIKTKLVEVTPPKNQTTNFTISQEDKEAEVVARSGNILVKQLVDLTWKWTNTQPTLLVDAWTNAHIDTSWISVYTPASQDEVVQLALDSKDLQIRYNTPTSWPQKNKESEQIALLAAVDESSDASLEETTIDEVTVGDDILQELTSKAKQPTTKKILTSELLAALTQTLHPSIAAENLAQMRQWKWVNTNAYIIAYSNLLDQVNYAYKLLELSQPATSTDSLDAGIVVAQNLLTTLEAEYALPPSLRSSLLTIINWLAALKNVEKENEHNAPSEDITAPEEQSVWDDSIDAHTKTIIQQAAEEVASDLENIDNITP